MRTLTIQKYYRLLHESYNFEKAFMTAGKRAVKNTPCQELRAASQRPWLVLTGCFAGLQSPQDIHSKDWAHLESSMGQ